MPRQRYVRGSFTLESNVIDLQAYYEQHKSKLDEIVAWANTLNIYVGFGTSEDHTYLCEYEVYERTAQMCKGVVAELKTMLKSEWKNVQLGYQVEGYTP